MSSLRRLRMRRESNATARNLSAEGLERMLPAENRTFVLWSNIPYLVDSVNSFPLGTHRVRSRTGKEERHKKPSESGYFIVMHTPDRETPGPSSPCKAPYPGHPLQGDCLFKPGVHPLSYSPINTRQAHSWLNAHPSPPTVVTGAGKTTKAMFSSENMAFGMSLP